MGIVWGDNMGDTLEICKAPETYLPTLVPDKHASAERAQTLSFVDVRL